MSSSSNVNTYAANLKKIEQIVKQLQTCDDVDVAVEMYESGQQLISDCKDRIDHAKKKYETMDS